MAKPKVIKVGDKDWLHHAVLTLRKGRVIVYPTDTAYGLGADATNPKAVERLERVKGRENQPIHVVVSSRHMAERYVEFSELAGKIFDKFMPGPITLILPLKERVTQVIEKLSAGTGALGVRVPDNRVAVRLSESLGRPITTTSANPHGLPTPYSTVEVMSQYSERDFQPDMYLDEGALVRVKPSTMIRVIDDRIEVVREGPVSKEAILSSLSPSGRSPAGG